MSQKKVVYLIGDTSNTEVLALIIALKSLGLIGIELKLATDDDYFGTVVLCLTDSGVSQDSWRIILNNHARILPVLFSKGRLPTIISDIKPADFVKDPIKGFADLLIAINRFC
jgi:hypothetical protein